jgi:hypothetical protein
MWKETTMPRNYRPAGLVVVVLLVLAVLAPVAAYAAGGVFTDDDTSVFEVDIEWMASTGITFGCNPPTNDNYCPNRAVTRGQMAAFMHRLADNQVVDAGELGGQAPAYYESMVWATDVEFGPLATTLATGGVTMAEMTIDLPYAGYLLINSSASIYDPDTDVQSLWWIQVDNTSCIANTAATTQVGLAYASVYANQRRQSAAIAGGFDATAGSHTVTLCGAATTSSNTQVYAPSLTVLFTTAGTVPTP